MASQFPCPEFLRDCECLPFPVRNFSVEAPDLPIFFGHYNIPPGNGTYFTPSCLGVCESLVSQELADQCAQRAAAECGFDGTPDDGNPVPGGRGGTSTPRFGNTLQTCDAECEGGSGTVTALVPPGTVVTATQADADARAHALACKEAERVRVCFSTTSPLPPACAGADYTAPILVFGGTPPYTFALVAGALPPGMDFFDVGLIQGNSSTVGIYTFDIQVTDSIGTTVIKTFELRVVAISTVFLNQIYPGVPYSDTLQSLGATGPVTWSVVAGVLPTGLSLNPSTGVISGTPAPTTTDQFFVTFQLVDSGSPPCLCTATPEWTRFCAGQAINVQDVTWAKFGGGTGSIVAGNGTFDNNLGDANGPNFTGDLCNDTAYALTVTIPFSASGNNPGPSGFNIRFQLTYNGVSVALASYGDGSAGAWAINDTAVLTATLPAQDLTTVRIFTCIKPHINVEASGTISITPLTRP